MAEFFLALELAIAAAAFLSGYLWWRASRRRLRRVSRHEILDHADINRIVTNLNRRVRSASTGNRKVGTPIERTPPLSSKVDIGEPPPSTENS